jgi:hypothetical protein
MEKQNVDEGVQAAMTSRNLEPDQCRNRMQMEGML